MRKSLKQVVALAWVVGSSWACGGAESHESSSAGSDEASPQEAALEGAEGPYTLSSGTRLPELGFYDREDRIVRIEKTRPSTTVRVTVKATDLNSTSVRLCLPGPLVPFQGLQYFGERECFEPSEGYGPHSFDPWEVDPAATATFEIEVNHYLAFMNFKTPGNIYLDPRPKPGCVAGPVQIARLKLIPTPDMPEQLKPIEGKVLWSEQEWNGAPRKGGANLIGRELTPEVLASLRSECETLLTETFPR